MLGTVARRLARFVAVLVIGGLLGAALVRFAPGFGTDERMLDARLSNASIQAIARERSDGSNVVSYYLGYLGRLAKGDLGESVSLGRPVRELLAERASTSLRSVSAGFFSAWAAALGLVLLLEWLGFRPLRMAASLSAGALLCVPAAVVAIACFYFSGPPALAIAAILFPRIFRYAQNLARHAAEAQHVFAAHAFGESRGRIFWLHVVAPVAPELIALAGVSVSMAIGAAIPVEALCDSPGVGQLVWQAALARDLPVIVNVTLLITALTLAANLAADVARGARGHAE
ncbi:MAG TPA: ABC transporter permease subunit [Bryobacteraceae bacterium]|nr:ABC transporter permease subunit [Bryobacteraceae bacterium]